jgi:prepilin-type N-terminal cleavage/methylation domain-containing protein
MQKSGLEMKIARSSGMFRGVAMKHFRESGFTILEVIVAIAVLAIGLLGVAAMQTKAIHSNYFAGVLTEKTSVAEAWMEWLINFSRQNYKIGAGNYSGYEQLAALDKNPNIGSDTALTLVCKDIETLKSDLQAWGLRPPNAERFDDSQLPKLPGMSYIVTWYIDANSPLQNTTTIRVETMEGGRAVSLTFLVSPNM